MAKGGFDIRDIAAALALFRKRPAVKEAINEWLDNHPEATTTVQDGAITLDKLNQEVIDATLNTPGSAADAGAVGEAIQALLDGKADKADTLLLTTLSRGRAEDTTVGAGSFAFGSGVTASGDYSRAFGAGTKATGFASTAEGTGTHAIGNQSHAEGSGTRANGNYSHSEGAGTQANGANSHSEGDNTNAAGESAHSEGTGTTASGYGAHSEGNGTLASANYSHAEGGGSKARGVGSHAEGNATEATHNGAHSEGQGTKATMSGAHSEGQGTTASGDSAHSEGAGTTASASGAHSEGQGSIASGIASHAEGESTIANGFAMHAMGSFNLEAGLDAITGINRIKPWQRDTEYKIGDVVQASNGYFYSCKVPNEDTTFTSSHWYCLGRFPQVFVIGNGAANNARSNAVTIFWDGSAHFAGRGIRIGKDGTAPTPEYENDLVAKGYVDGLINDLGLSVVDGLLNITWTEESA